MEFGKLIQGYPVIPALRLEWGRKTNLSALRGGGPCFLLDGNINTLNDVLRNLERYFATIFLHVDLFSGLSPDQDGLAYLRNHFKSVHGIISTRSRALTIAKKQGFKTIFRIFLLDSESLNTGLKVATQLSPDAIEILPGVIFPVVKELIPVKSLPPLICGGFIRSQKEIEQILQAGATAVSTSSPDLWIFETKSLGMNPKKM